MGRIAALLLVIGCLSNATVANANPAYDTALRYGQTMRDTVLNTDFGEGDFRALCELFQSAINVRALKEETFRSIHDADPAMVSDNLYTGALVSYMVSKTWDELVRAAASLAPVVDMAGVTNGRYYAIVRMGPGRDPTAIYTDANGKITQIKGGQSRDALDAYSIAKYLGSAINQGMDTKCHGRNEGEDCGNEAEAVVREFRDMIRSGFSSRLRRDFPNGCP